MAEAAIDRNLLGTILNCQAMAKEMMARRQGRIVTIDSAAAFKGRTCSLPGSPLQRMELPA